MKTCSYCQHENDDAAMACSVCGVNFPVIVPELQDPALALVIVGEFSNVVDAGIAKSLLESEGIEACVPEELSPQLFGAASPNPTDRITVRVAAKDAVAAKEILETEG